VHVWGPRWEYHVTRRSRNPIKWFEKTRSLPSSVVGGVLSDRALVELYSRSRINLGFATVGETHRSERITQVRLRDFEVPMSGGFYLAEHSNELSDFFTPGVEIETWKSQDELLDKCRYYLLHDDERRRIASAGRVRALREHTWEHRFRDAFEFMGLT
jgi:spore maturation protein CgeB